MSKFSKKLTTTVLFALCAIILFSILEIAATPQSWQEKFQKYLYHEQPVSEDIVIVYIDETSLSEDALGRWQDWSREYYATAIENLNEAGATTIAIDLVFNRESSGLSEDNLIEALTSNNYAEDLIDDLLTYVEDEHPDDQIMAAALEEAGNVILIKYPYYDEEGNIIYESSSMELIGSQATAEGYAVAEIPQSELVLKVLAKGSFDAAIAEHFSKQTAQIPMTDNDHMYINYVGPAGAYKYFSFSDIHAGNFEPEEITDKIILIGIGTPTLQDHYTVPLGDARMYGVEIHANAIQTILDENYLQEASAGTEIVILTILATAATALFMYLGIWWTIPAFVVLGGAYDITVLTAFSKGTILNLIYPYVMLMTIYISVALYRYMTELKEKKQVKSAFGHYVSKDVVDDIMKDPENLKLGGENREVTVFFTDIANFTGWSEGTTPEALVAQLNEYFDAISGVIMKNKGTVDKFEGDAIMAFWNAPLEVENHEVLACQSALEARGVLSELNKKWAQEGKKEIGFRIGINTGEAVIGNMGSSERFDYTAIGDNVNLSARLEGANKFYNTQIMISGNTAAKLGDTFELRRLDRIRVKGKEEPVDIYELLAPKGQLPKEALKIINTFHQAIEYYRNANWTEAETRFKEVLAKTPNDGPTKTYLDRIEQFKSNPPQNWDGTWNFDSK